MWRIARPWCSRRKRGSRGPGVAAHRARRLVVRVDPPARDAQISRGQQAALDARGQLQIPLERALLAGRQVVKAESNQWIGDQPVLLNRVVAGLADAVGTLLHALERLIHFLQELRERP